MDLGPTRPLTEMSTKNPPGSKGQLWRKADNLTAICPENVEALTSQDPTGLHSVSRDSFTRNTMAITLVSPGEIHLNGPSSSSSGCVECVRIMFTFPGIIREKTCFPGKRNHTQLKNSFLPFGNRRSTTDATKARKHYLH
jgi:hypothetical protein